MQRSAPQQKDDEIDVKEMVLNLVGGVTLCYLAGLNPSVWLTLLYLYSDKINWDQVVVLIKAIIEMWDEMEEPTPVSSHSSAYLSNQQILSQLGVSDQLISQCLLGTVPSYSNISLRDSLRQVIAKLKEMNSTTLADKRLLYKVERFSWFFTERILLKDFPEEVRDRMIRKILTFISHELTKISRFNPSPLFFADSGERRLALTNHNGVESYIRDFIERYGNCYQILGLHGVHVKKENIVAAYRNLAPRLHPDKNKSRTAKEDFDTLTQARNILLDPGLRKIHDKFVKSKHKLGFEPHQFSYVEFRDNKDAKKFNKK